MHRTFPRLAVTVATLLVAAFVVGLIASGEDRRVDQFWHHVHFLLGLLATMSILMIHSVVYTYLLGTGKWVREVLRVYPLPEALEGMAIRNKRRVFPFVLLGMLLAGGTAWLGAAADTRRGFNPLWHLAFAAVAMAFNLGAFLMEYASCTAQARLVLEVKDQADRLREAQLADTP